MERENLNPDEPTEPTEPIDLTNHDILLYLDAQDAHNSRYLR